MPRKNLTEAARREAEITKMLLELAVVYWAPNFTPGQAAARMDQYLDDLRPFTVHEVRTGIEGHRRSPAPFYPSPGQIIAHIPRYEPPRSDDEFRQRVIAWQRTGGWPSAWGGDRPGSDPRHSAAVLAELKLGPNLLQCPNTDAINVT